MKLAEQIAQVEYAYQHGVTAQQQISQITQTIKQLSQGELKQLAIQLMQQQTLLLFYGLILKLATLRTLESFQLELRIINNHHYIKYKKGIEQAIKTKSQEKLWDNVTTFEY